MNTIPLVLLPGTLCDDRLWHPVLSLLPEWVEVFSFHSEQHRNITDWANTVLEQAPPHFALAGFSMGGSAALEIARLQPERLLGLALMSTNPWGEIEDRTAQRAVALDTARRVGMRRLISESLWESYVHQSRLEDWALQDLVISMAESEGVDVYENQLALLSSRDNRIDVFHRLSCPTLLLCGESDKLCPASWHEEMYCLLNTKAWLEIIQNCGHLLPLESPRFVSRALSEWLEFCLGG